MSRKAVLHWAWTWKVRNPAEVRSCRRGRPTTLAKVWQINLVNNPAKSVPGNYAKNDAKNDTVLQSGQVEIIFPVGPDQHQQQPPRSMSERNVSLTPLSYGFQLLPLKLEDERCQGPRNMCIQRGALAGDFTLFVAVYFLGTLVSRVIGLHDDDCKNGKKVLAAVSGSRASGHQVVHLAGCGFDMHGPKFQVQFDISRV